MKKNYIKKLAFLMTLVLLFCQANIPVLATPAEAAEEAPAVLEPVEAAAAGDSESVVIQYEAYQEPELSVPEETAAEEAVTGDAGKDIAGAEGDSAQTGEENAGETVEAVTGEEAAAEMPSAADVSEKPEAEAQTELSGGTAVMETEKAAAESTDFADESTSGESVSDENISGEDITDTSVSENSGSENSVAADDAAAGDSGTELSAISVEQVSANAVGEETELKAQGDLQASGVNNTRDGADRPYLFYAGARLDIVNYFRNVTENNSIAGCKVGSGYGKYASINKKGIMSVKKTAGDFEITAYDQSGNVINEYNCRVLKPTLKFSTVNSLSASLNILSANCLTDYEYKGYAPYYLKSQKEYDFSSSKTSVATVDEYGNIKVLKAGTTTITAKFNYYGDLKPVKVKAKLKVVIPKLSKLWVGLKPGQSTTVTLKGGDNVKWATVGKRVTVTASGKGNSKATIRAVSIGVTWVYAMVGDDLYAVLVGVDDGQYHTEKVCGGSEVVAREDYKLEAKIIAEVNKRRRAKGLKDIIDLPTLFYGAKARALDFTTGVIGTVRPDGTANSTAYTSGTVKWEAGSVGKTNVKDILSPANNYPTDESINALGCVVIRTKDKLSIKNKKYNIFTMVAFGTSQ